ncbi:hypothetical protein Ancab_017265 [Ancistrocladus abbreviatus]
MSFLRRLLSALISLLFILSIISPPAESTSFKCATTTKNCKSIIDYVSPNTTTLFAIKTLFGIKNLRSLLGVNSLPLSTSPNATVSAQQTIKIPFPCLCANGTGVSNRLPIYTVVPGDFLYHIAAEVFSGLVTVNQIQAVNGIKNVSLIEIGQKLWIPLPCSCDEVDGQGVVHYGYVVPSGSSVSQIAAEYGTTEQTLLSLNGMSNASQLLAGQVLDVPLKACTSSIKNSSLDYPLLVANGTYVLTANNCVLCKCDAANNYTLQCAPSQLKPTNWSTCPSMLCSSNAYIGNTTSSSCSSTSCAYAGYTSQSILTTLDTQSTCPAPSNLGSNMHSEVWSTLLIFGFAHLFTLYFL